MIDLLTPSFTTAGTPVLVTHQHGMKRGVFWLIVGVLFFVFLFMIRSILLPFLLGIFIAYFLHPVADKMERRWKLSRGATTGIIVGGFFAVLLAVLLLIIPVIVNQVSGLVTALPGYVTKFNQQYGWHVSQLMGKLSGDEVDSIKEAAGNASGVAFKMAGTLIAGVFQSGMALLDILSLILIMPIVAFYMLRDWDNVVLSIRNLLPRPYAHTVQEQLRIIDRTLAGFIRGQINICLLLGAYYAVALSIAGLKFGILIGLGTGMLVVFPYVGLLLGTTIGMATAFFQFDSYSHIFVILGIFVTGQITEAYFLTPKLVGAKVGLHPVWIIFGMLAGGALFGFVGVLLAVPLTAVIGVLIRFMIQNYLQSSYYQGEIQSEIL